MIVEHTKGRWRSILSTLGVNETYLQNKHGPCPMCDGKDRWRWDDKDGKGTYFCTKCGAGDGFTLLQKFKGWDFKTAAKHVEGIIGTTTYDAPRQAISDEKRRDMLRGLYRQSQAIAQGDPVDRYLEARGIAMEDYPETLRTVPEAKTSCGKTFSMMLAQVDSPDGPVSLHRTWIEGAAKAPIESPRKLMPGKHPDSFWVRLGGYHETLGVAEGIETALAASRLAGVPVWACLTARSLSRFKPPEGVTRLIIFGDNDQSYTGHAASYSLARRVYDKCAVEVRIPPHLGDFNDVWKKRLADESR